MNKKITVSAPCKVHFLGEWAVVWGKPALLATVNLRITANITTLSTVIASVAKQSSPDKNSTQIASSQTPRNDELRRIIEPIVKQEFNIKTIPPYELKIESQIPMGCHLGSSAAVSVVSIAALLSHLNIKWDLDLVNKLAYEAEKVFHGNPSGADNSTIVYGGLMWYRKEISDLKIIQKLNLTIPSSLTKNFVLINTGTPKMTTKEMITHITTLFDQKPTLKTQFLEKQEKLTRELLTAVSQGVEQEVMRIIREGEVNLESIGVCSPSVAKIIREIEKLGGAAKICGAGASEGPTGVLLCYHEDKSVVEKVAKENNLDYFSTELGVEGLRQES